MFERTHKESTTGMFLCFTLTQKETAPCKLTRKKTSSSLSFIGRRRVLTCLLCHGVAIFVSLIQSVSKGSTGQRSGLTYTVLQPTGRSRYTAATRRRPLVGSFASNQLLVWTFLCLAAYTQSMTEVEEVLRPCI